MTGVCEDCIHWKENEGCIVGCKCKNGVCKLTNEKKKCSQYCTNYDSKVGFGSQLKAS
jgi:hypothetical protein